MLGWRPPGRGYSPGCSALTPITIGGEVNGAPHAPRRGCSHFAPTRLRIRAKQAEEPRINRTHRSARCRTSFPPDQGVTGHGRLALITQRSLDQPADFIARSASQTASGWKTGIPRVGMVGRGQEGGTRKSWQTREGVRGSLGPILALARTGHSDARLPLAPRDAGRADRLRPLGVRQPTRGTLEP